MIPYILLLLGIGLLIVVLSKADRKKKISYAIAASALALTSTVILDHIEIQSAGQIILDKRNETIRVAPGTEFCIERTVRKGINRFFSPLYSRDLELTKIQVVDEEIEFYNESTVDKKIPYNFTYETNCQDITNTTYRCNKTDIHYNITYKTVTRNKTITTYTLLSKNFYYKDSKSKPSFIEEKRTKLPAKAREMEVVGYTNLFDLDEDKKIQACFKAPSWEESRRGEKPSSGRISFMAGDDWEGTTWWDSYDHRRAINCSSMSDKFPLVINGSVGFSISAEGGQQIVWTYCSGTGSALYYNNFTDYVVANDTDQLPMEVELGNGTSYNPTQVWNDILTGNSEEAVWHLGEGSGSTINSSEGNAINGTHFEGTSTFVEKNISFEDVKIGYGAGFSTQQPTINQTILTESDPKGFLNFTFAFWYNLSHTAQTTQLLGWGDTNHFFHMIRPDTGTIRCQYYEGAGPTCIQNTASLPTGVHHYACRNNGTHTQGYLDGNTSGDPTVCNTGIYSPDTYRTVLLAGGRASGTSFVAHINASLDGVWILNKSLASDEINQTYQNAIGTTGFGDLGAEETLPTAPTISQPIIYPTVIFTINNTNASTIPTDTENTTLQVEYFWRVDGVIKSYGNLTGVQNGSTIGIPELGSGNYTKNQIINISVRAWDGTSWSYWNSTRKNVSNMAPSYILVAPADSSWHNGSSITLWATASDPDEDPINYHWYIDGSYNSTTANNYTTLSFSQGSHTWQIQVGDGEDNSSLSSAWSFYVDLIEPETILFAPEDGLETTQTSQTFNWTVIDNMDTVLDCNLTINSIVNVTTTVNNGTHKTLTKSFGDGIYFWNVTCWDNAGNINWTETRNFTIDSTGPSITLTHPTADQYVWDRTPVISFTLNEIANCSVSIDGGSNTLLGKGITSYNDDEFHARPLDSGEHSFNISCIDLLGNENSTNVNSSINHFKFANDALCNTVSFDHSGGTDSNHHIKIPDNAFNISASLNLTGSEAKVSIPANAPDIACSVYWNYESNSTSTDCTGAIDLGQKRWASNYNEVYRIFLDFNDLFHLPTWNVTEVKLCMDTSLDYDAGPGCDSRAMTLYLLLKSFNASVNWTNNDTQNTWDSQGGDYNSTSLDSVAFYDNDCASPTTSACFSISGDLYEEWAASGFPGWILRDTEDCGSIPCGNTYSISNILLHVNYTSYPHNITLNSFFDWNSSYLNYTENLEISSKLENNLSGTQGNKTITLNFESDSGGNVTFCLINNSFQLKHFDPVAELSDGIPYFYFFPRHRSEKNVSAWKQNSSIGVLNVTNNNTSIADLMIRVNSTIQKVDLKCSNDSSVQNSTNITTSYQSFYTKFLNGTTHMLWCWADYFNPPSLPSEYEVWLDFWSWD